MSGAVSIAKKAVSSVVSTAVDPLGLTSAVTGTDIGGEIDGLFGVGSDSTSTATDTTEQDAQDAAQADATNAARVASTKKKSTTSSVLTSPLGASTSATTAITKLGGS